MEVCWRCSLAESEGHPGTTRACLLCWRPPWNRCGVKCSPPSHTIQQPGPHPPRVTPLGSSQGGQCARTNADAHVHWHSAAESSNHFPLRADSGPPERPTGHRAPAICRMCVSSWRPGHSAPSLSCGLMASGVLFGCRGLSEMGWGDGWGCAGQEQSQRGGERGTSVWAGVRGVGPGPRGRAAPPGSGSGSGSGAGLAQKTRVAMGR